MQNCHYQTKPLAFALSPSVPLSLCLGAAELSGSTRADSSAPVPPGGRQKTKRGWTEAVTLQRPLRKRERFSRGANVLQPQLNKERVSFFQKRRERKVFFHAQVVKSSRDLLYFYTVESIRHQRGHLFICIIPTSFLGTFLFPLSVRLSCKREPGYGRRGDTTRKPSIHFYAFASKGTEATGEPSALPPLLPLPPVGKSDSGDINAFRK